MLLFQYVFVENIVICDVFLCSCAAVVISSIFSLPVQRGIPNHECLRSPLFWENSKRKSMELHCILKDVPHLDDEVDAKYQKMGDTNCKERS